MYYYGQGVIQDNVYAHMWWNVAASNENTLAVGNRDRITKYMTAVDLSKAQGLARACVAKKYNGCADCWSNSKSIEKWKLISNLLVL